MIYFFGNLFIVLIVCLRCCCMGWKYVFILIILFCELMELMIEIFVECFFFVLDYGVMYGCIFYVMKYLVVDGFIIFYEMFKCNG